MPDLRRRPAVPCPPAGGLNEALLRADAATPPSFRRGLPMQLPLAYLDFAAIAEVSRDLWIEIFDQVGWPPSIPDRAGFTHDDVLNAIQRDEPTADLLLALEAMHTLGTEAGREAIQRALAAAPQGGGASIPPDVGEREFAVRLFLGQRTDGRLADVFARAQAEVDDQGGRRRYSEYIAREPRRIRELEARSLRLRDAMAQYCKANDLGEHVQVRAFEDDDAYVFHVIHSHHLKKPLAVMPGQSAHALLEFRPVHGDLLRYDATRGRLRVSARAPSLVQRYRRMLGEALFDDPSFFDSEGVCSLSVLKEKGRRALESHSVAGVGRVWMTECGLDVGEDFVRIRAADCFNRLEKLGGLQDAEFVEARLKIQVAATSTRPVTVYIRVPTVIDPSNRRFEPLIDAYLDAIGVRLSSAAVVQGDLWRMHPWRHPAQTWRDVFGKVTDRLVAQGVLVRIRLDAVAHPEHPGAGRVLDVHAIGDGQYHGVSRVPEVPARRLSATDIEGLELMPDELQAYLRGELGLSGPCSGWAGDELLDLGELAVGAHTFRLLYAMRQPRVGVGGRARQLAGATRAVLLLPGPRSRAAEVAEVMLSGPIPSRRGLVREVIYACGCETEVAAVHVAPDHVRLVVDDRTKEVWFDGILVPGLRPDGHPYGFVLEMARAGLGIVTSVRIAEALSPNRKDDQTARGAKAKALKAIRAAVKAAGGAAVGDIFPSAGTGAYRCAIPAHVVQGGPTPALPTSG